MSYRIYGKPLTHDEMIEIAKATQPRLYAVLFSNDENKVIPVHVEGIYIDLNTRQWTFKFVEDYRFDDIELIFKSRTSAEKYLKRKQ